MAGSGNEGFLTSTPCIRLAGRVVENAKRFADEDPHPDTPASKQARCLSSPFFNLPQEVRDDIYSLAFEPDARINQPIHRTIHFTGFSLVAYRANDRFNILAPYSQRGLRLWTVVSKQFLAEAIASFARDRIFEVKSNFLRETATQVPRHPLPTLLQSIRTIRAPCARTRYTTALGTKTIEFKKADENALATFFALRGEDKPVLNLEMYWEFDLHCGFDDSDPVFRLSVLMQQRHTFSRVTITAGNTSCIKHRSKALLRGHSPLNPLPLAQTLYDAAKDKLWKHAEFWAQSLVRQDAGKGTKCTTSEEEADEFWYGYDTCFKTVEAVDGETKPTTRLEAKMC
ncbi:hypothetical protein CC86DRAFT_400436 [Ophiobolus disseminans]|uniref:F-box domain-containing protein n=1 Tax=Ophiobolus disseminans TaxID=1469910 RepID=A0A6A7AL09_9PLEO|nr:hypothetical protein CC86DRAFT_400436 [Ophiobolus disseminans]